MKPDLGDYALRTALSHKDAGRGKVRRFRTRDGLERAEARVTEGAQGRANAAEARRERKRQRNLRAAAAGGIGCVAAGAVE